MKKLNVIVRALIVLFCILCLSFIGLGFTAMENGTDSTLYFILSGVSAAIMVLSFLIPRKKLALYQKEEAEARISALTLESKPSAVTESLIRARLSERGYTRISENRYTLSVIIKDTPKKNISYNVNLIFKFDPEELRKQAQAASEASSSNAENVELCFIIVKDNESEMLASVTEYVRSVLSEKEKDRSFKEYVTPIAVTEDAIHYAKKGVFRKGVNRMLDILEYAPNGIGVTERDGVITVKKKPYASDLTVCALVTLACIIFPFIFGEMLRSPIFILFFAAILISNAVYIIRLLSGKITVDTKKRLITVYSPFPTAYCIDDITEIKSLIDQRDEAEIYELVLVMKNGSSVTFRTSCPEQTERIIGILNQHSGKSGKN